MPLPRTTATRKRHSSGIRRYRATVRMRLALTYSALLTGSGIIMLGLVYVFMRFVPTYDLAAGRRRPPPRPPSRRRRARSRRLRLPGSPIGRTPAADHRSGTASEFARHLHRPDAQPAAARSRWSCWSSWLVVGSRRRLGGRRDACCKPAAVHQRAPRAEAAHGDLRPAHRPRRGRATRSPSWPRTSTTMLAQLERSFAASKRFALERLPRAAHPARHQPRHARRRSSPRTPTAPSAPRRACTGCAS